MGRLGKRARHLQDVREAKKRRRLKINEELLTYILHEAHWEGLSDSEEESDAEISEPEDNISDEGKEMFEKLLSAAKLEWSHTANATKFPYQRGPERGLWRDRRADGSKFYLTCPKTHGCDPALNGECCATTLLQSQRDFKEQKGWLQEEVEAAGHSVIFYPKFHCELNFIERFWCAAKHYARENCVYTIDGLRGTIPTAFKSIPTATINRFYKHCSRIIDAYSSGHKYGTKAFTQHMYKNHRQVVDKSKW
jgi:hypothetical protein